MGLYVTLMEALHMTAYPKTLSKEELKNTGKDIEILREQMLPEYEVALHQLPPPSSSSADDTTLGFGKRADQRWSNRWKFGFILWSKSQYVFVTVLIDDKSMVDANESSWSHKRILLSPGKAYPYEKEIEVIWNSSTQPKHSVLIIEDGSGNQISRNINAERLTEEN